MRAIDRRTRSCYNASLWTSPTSTVCAVVDPVSADWSWRSWLYVAHAAGNALPGAVTPCGDRLVFTGLGRLTPPGPAGAGCAAQPGGLVVRTAGGPASRAAAGRPAQPRRYAQP